MNSFAGFVFAVLIGGLFQLLYIIGYVISVKGRPDVAVNGFPFLLAFGLLVGACAGLIAALLPRTSIRGADNYFVLLVLAVVFPTCALLVVGLSAYGVIIYGLAVAACAIICSQRYRDTFWD